MGFGLWLTVHKQGPIACRDCGTKMRGEAKVILTVSLSSSRYFTFIPRLNTTRMFVVCCACRIGLNRRNRN